MPAYNFKPEFVDDILTGRKTSTIRALGKRPPPKPGETLYLFTGMRTKKCRKLLTVPCLQVSHIVIKRGGMLIDGKPTDFEQRRLISRADGFAHFHDLANWFGHEHGLPFSGHLIVWKPNPLAL
jgi:hypothetical protein